MDVNVILKYKRDRDCWLCSVCETENEIIKEKCAVCGCKKASALTTLKAWSPEDEKRFNSAKTTEFQKTATIDRNKVVFESKSTPKSEEVKVFHDLEEPINTFAENKSSAGKVILIVILIVVLLAAFISMYSDNYMYDSNFESTDFCVIEQNHGDLFSTDIIKSEYNICENNNFELTEG